VDSRTAIPFACATCTWEELFEEMDRENRSFDAVEGIDSAELIRQGREERDRELMGRILGDDEGP
jgi:hypothetical protein